MRNYLKLDTRTRQMVGELRPTATGPSTRPEGFLKVLEVIASLEIGGAERALANRLRFQPPHIQTTIAYGPTRSGPTIDIPKSIDTVKVQSWRSELPALIDRVRPDLVVIHSPSMLIRAAMATRSIKSPVMVFVSHGQVLSESSLRNLVLQIPFRLAIRRASAAIAVSERAMRRIPKLLPSKVVPLGASIGATGLYDEADDPSRAVRLLVLSRLNKNKQVDLIIEALSSLKKDQRSVKFTVDVVGDGPELDSLLQLTERRGLSTAITFHGAVNDPTPFLVRADYLVVASRSEGGPITVFEAMLAGANIVATNVGIVPEIKSALPHRLIVSPSNSESGLRQALLEAVESGPIPFSLRLSYILEGSRFDTSVCADSFYAFLLNIRDANHR